MSDVGLRQSGMTTFLIVSASLLLALLSAQFVLSRQFESKVSDLGRRLLLSQVSSPPDMSLIPIIMREFAIRSAASDQLSTIGGAILGADMGSIFNAV